MMAKLARENMTAEDRLAAAAATIGSMPQEQIDRQLERIGAVPPGTGALSALQEAVMAVCWAADTPLSATAVFQRLDYTAAVTRCTVADCLLRLHRTGYLTREPLNGRAWLYRSARPLAVHLACVIADLLQCSPDPAVTLRLALAGGGCNADPERDRRSIS